MSTATASSFESINTTLKTSQTGTQMNTKTKPGNSRFDYNTIDAEFQDEAREAAKRIHRRLRTAVFDTGRDLIMIKGKLNHGQFGAWIRGEFNMDRRTATNYMNAARLQEQKREIISHFSPTTVYTLGAPSTPVAVVEEVLALAEGEVG